MKLFAYLNNQKGVVLVLSALLAVVLLGLAGLSIDVGNLYLQKLQMQNAADAAVLAGGQQLPDTSGATATALQYITDNGQDPTNASVTFSNGNSRINVTLTKNVPTYFMPVLGISSVPVTVSAAGVLSSAGGPFDYAIFSGSKTANLNITGGGWIAKGSIHTNDNLNLTGGGFEVTGAAEAEQKVTVTGGGYSIGSIANNAGYVAMPDYSSAIAAAAAASGQEYTGNKTITGGGFSLGNNIYVQGNVNITGGAFTSSGAIMADGNITITGGGISIAGSNQVCFYSKNGNITFTGGGAAFNGVLYAPHGTITITGGGTNFNGSIVGNQVVLTGGGINVDRSDYPITSLPSTHVRLVQ
jgi:Flp pilus assembly protein TadG